MPLCLSGVNMELINDKQTYLFCNNKFSPVKILPQGAEQITASNLSLSHSKHYDFLWNVKKQTILILGLANQSCNFKLRFTGNFYKYATNYYYVGGFSVIK